MLTADREALLDAFVESWGTDDWSDGLVLADWLEDAGEAGLAAAVRYMVAERKRPMPVGVTAVWWDCRFNEDKLPPHDTASDLPTPVFVALRDGEVGGPGGTSKLYRSAGAAIASLAEALGGLRRGGFAW